MQGAGAVVRLRLGAVGRNVWFRVTLLCPDGAQAQSVNFSRNSRYAVLFEPATIGPETALNRPAREFDREPADGPEMRREFPAPL